MIPLRHNAPCPNGPARPWSRQTGSHAIHVSHPAAVVHPSPTATLTQSTGFSAVCSANSRPYVFFPSTRYGSLAQFRSYQPNSHALPADVRRCVAPWNGWRHCRHRFRYGARLEKPGSPRPSDPTVGSELSRSRRHGHVSPRRVGGPVGGGYLGVGAVFDPPVDDLGLGHARGG
jgi:hypothetical protein